ncbi:DUF2185 domain-containing protein [Neisseria zalophi]|uniref:DUF2185 domain-containing protein n=1 Tax=Neisseria zalophi TaxID=640030 RepID=A0A5J6PUA5_9NEIS|nr:DUF2185 domain-containing protein [Neisseria zalophi]QEY26281.1 DUF2185 domain-containing protein [Neisseria zalophi]
MNAFANLSQTPFLVIAAKTVTEEGAPVGFMYREASDFKDDTGWRFFQGDETDEYTANPDNFVLYSIKDIADRNPAIVPYLQSPPGHAWELNEEGEFEPVEDWQPQE